MFKAEDESDYAENEVTYDMLNYCKAFNVFEWVRKVLDRLDVPYERVCIANPKEEEST